MWCIGASQYNSRIVNNNFNTLDTTILLDMLNVNPNG